VVMAFVQQLSGELFFLPSQLTTRPFKLLMMRPSNGLLLEMESFCWCSWSVMRRPSRIRPLGELGDIMRSAGGAYDL